MQITSDPQGEREARERIVAALQARRCDPQDIFNIELALTEALTNAIRHGNRFDAKKRVRVTFTLEADWITIEIADQGTGFAPEKLADPTSPAGKLKPNGRGVFLIRKFMDEVVYNRRGNSLTMCKRLRAARPRPGFGPGVGPQPPENQPS